MATGRHAKDIWRGMQAIVYTALMIPFDGIRAFIQRLSPQSVCDECIAERLGIDLALVAKHTIEVAGTAGFKRRTDECALCGATTHVIGQRS